jgi:fumarate reductase flavoprotein subunit
MSSIDKSKSEELKADIVIIGSGGGLAAAVAAREMGADVLLLEKVGVLGGYTRQANGMMACESPVQKRMNVVVSRDTCFKTFMNWSHWYRINPRIVRAFVNKTGDTIRWLEEKGVKFEINIGYSKEGLQVVHLPEGMGAGVQRALIKKAEALGVRVLNKTSAKKILHGPKGVTGVTAVVGEKEIQITAKSVIIATGGFADNKELLKKHCQDYYDGMPLDEWPHHAAHSGDGLLMAEEIGGAIAHSVPIYHLGPYYPGFFYPWQSLLAMALNYNTIWINKRGRRFIDESGCPAMVSGNAILLQPDKVMYSVFDDLLRKNVEDGIDEMEGIPPKQAGKGGGTKVLEKGFPGLAGDLRKQVQSGNTIIANSWDELALAIGAKPNILKAEIDEYNSFCEKGHDAVFGKAAKNLHPMIKPPFYAMKCYARVGETLGGVIVNEHMEILDTEGNVIPGAYIAGVLADGFQGQTYCTELSGSAMGFAVNSGRIAGENAAKYALG